MVISIFFLLLKNMYFHLPEHIYLAYFNDEIIVLDLLNDKYINLQSHISRILEKIIKNNFYLDKNNIFLLDDYDNTRFICTEEVNLLCNLGILSRTNFPTPSKRSFLNKKSGTGLTTTEWFMPYAHLNNHVPFRLLSESFFSLLKTHFLLKKRGLLHVINKIKSIGNEINDIITPPTEEVCILARAINRSSIFLPLKTTCIEWSITLVLMSLRRGWRTNLTIGVQNLPFRAHAWVALNEKVIEDSPDLSDEMSIILQEPFN